MSDSLRLHRLYSPWNSPGKNTGVGDLSILQGIFPTQGLKPGLPRCRQILYQLSHKGSPRILEWVVYPCSSRSSWHGNQTWVSCIAGGFFTNWAMRAGLSNLFYWDIVVQLLSHTWFFVTPWIAAHQASLSFTVSQSLLRLVHWAGDKFTPIKYIYISKVFSIFKSTITTAV